jgi:uncharacterized iron-regulated membrane protein
MKLKPFLLQIHLWLGLILCIPLVLLGITGTLLVFERAVVGGHTARHGPSQPVAAMIAVARNAAGETMQPVLFVPPPEPGDLATVRMTAGRGQKGGAQFFVDPVTLETTAPAPGGFMRQVHMLHGNLLIQGRDGRSIIGWLGVVMLAMGLTGLYLWWPRPGRWRAAFTISRRARGVRLHRQLHGAAGIWGLAVFVTVSFTGVDLAFPETMASAIGRVLPGAEMRPLPAPKVMPDVNAIDIDRAIALAVDAVPGGELRAVGMPTGPDQPYRIGLVRAGTGQGAPFITVFVDPWTARVLEIRDPATYRPGLRLIAWQHAIHSGAGLGLLWRIAVGLSGLLPALFAITGIAMWILKRRNRSRTMAVAE